MDQNCNAHGKCTCKENVIGDKCDIVIEEFYDITDPKGTYTNVAIISQYGHSQSEKKLGVGDKYHRSIKIPKIQI